VWTDVTFDKPHRSWSEGHSCFPTRSHPPIRRWIEAQWAPGPSPHRLSDVDLDAETATCSICGEGTTVLISRRRGTGARYARMCLSRYPAVQERYRQWLADNTSWALTDEERAAMLARQGGVCANPSCGTPDSGRSRWTRLATDHDHTSEVDNVRGLICRRCNGAIGMAGDNPTGVLGLAVYLAAYERRDLAGALRHMLAAVTNGASPKRLYSKEGTA
jgi:hypothetical protein